MNKIIQRIALGILGVSLSLGINHICSYAAPSDIQQYNVNAEYNKLKGHLDNVKILYMKDTSYNTDELPLDYTKFINNYTPHTNDNITNALKAFSNILRYSNNDIGSPEFISDSKRLFNRSPLYILKAFPLFVNDLSNLHNKNKVAEAFVNIGLGSNVIVYGDNTIIQTSKTTKLVMDLLGVNTIIGDNDKIVIVSSLDGGGFNDIPYSGCQIKYNKYPGIISIGIKNIEYIYVKLYYRFQVGLE